MSNTSKLFKLFKSFKLSGVSLSLAMGMSLSLLGLSALTGCMNISPEQQQAEVAQMLYGAQITPALYTSPKKTFQVTIPKLPNPITLTATTNFNFPDVTTVEKLYVSAGGLQMGVVVSKPQNSIPPDFIDIVFSNVPSHIKEGNIEVPLAKVFTETPYGRAVVIIKGPLDVPPAYTYEFNAILPYKGLIYDFFITSFPCKTKEQAKGDAEKNFINMLNSLVLKGGE